MIACDEITVRAAGKRLLSRVSLAVPGGELWALVGPNGAGKSTLLHVLAGDLAPESGEVSALGRPLRSWSLAELARVRAVLPQEATLQFPLTALEVVLLGRTPHVRFTETDHDLALARSALGSVGLACFEDRLYPTLSGGERQRVQLARALAQLDGHPRGAPRILLLDEPTASLDPAHQQRTLQLARELARDGAAVLAVLHDLNLAAQYADAVVLLQAGEVCACGPPSEVLCEPLLRRVFSVPMRVLPTPWAPSRLVVVVDDDRER